MDDPSSQPPAPSAQASYYTWNLTAHALEKQESDILGVLGAALVTHWSELPRDIQKRLFETAADETGTSLGDVRGSLAKFLHTNGNQGH